MNTTELRKDIFNILDQVLTTGQPVEVRRKGGTLKIVREMPVDRIAKLKGKKRKKAFVGNSDDIIDMDWSKEWKPKHI